MRKEAQRLCVRVELIDKNLSILACLAFVALDDPSEMSGIDKIETEAVFPLKYPGNAGENWPAGRSETRRGRGSGIKGEAVAF